MIARNARREPGESVHEFQHRLIAARYAAWAALPKRSGADRIARREADKRCWWTMTGHLRGMHHVRGQAPFLRKTWADLVAMHEARHADDR